MVLKARYEVCGFACGTVDNKEPIDEDIDIRTRSIGYFTERKINGNVYEFILKRHNCDSFQYRILKGLTFVYNSLKILSEIVTTHLEMKVLKRSAVLDILDMKENCKFVAFGAYCDDGCGLCAIRDDYNSLRTLYVKRHKLGQQGQHDMYRTLIKILAKKEVNGTVLAGLDDFDAIALFVALEQLRQALSLHIRGCKLSNAPLLESLLTFYRKALSEHKPKDPVSKFMDTKTLQISVFNDDKAHMRDFERKHLMHCTLDFTAGYIIGGHPSFKKGWKDEDTLEILNKAESVKRKIRHTIFNQEKDLCFAPPHFDTDKKVFLTGVNEKEPEKNIGNPIKPLNVFNRTLIL